MWKVTTEMFSSGFVGMGETKTVKSLQANRDFSIVGDGRVEPEMLDQFSSAGKLESLTDPRVDELYKAFVAAAPGVHRRVNVYPSEAPAQRQWGEKFDSLVSEKMGPGWGGALYVTGNYQADSLTVYLNEGDNQQALSMTKPDTDDKEGELERQKFVEPVHATTSQSKNMTAPLGVNRQAGVRLDGWLDARLIIKISCGRS